jgi:Sir2 family
LTEFHYIFRCSEKGCDGLIRPHVVWFGESLYPDVLARASEELSKCDLCLVVCSFFMYQHWFVCRGPECWAHWDVVVLELADVLLVKN